MANGMSALIVSRIGLPLSIVSAVANNSRFASKRSAILSNIFARSCTDVLPHLSAAACAASNANSTSAAPDRAALVYGKPVIGVITSKYSPLTGATHFPPIKLSYLAL